MTRRSFTRYVAATATGFAALRQFASAAPKTRQSFQGYGELVQDPNRLIDLPPGFSYKAFSPAGEKMADGFLVPGKHDGMGAFTGPRGTTILVRNHELTTDSADGAFGTDRSLLTKLPKHKIYDAGKGEHPALGGTTTVLYDTKKQQLQTQFLSLAGTVRNCAGGVTPWKTWITCEESTIAAQSFFERDHGYNFEVPASSRPQVTTPVPLKAMGRFVHEAVAVDARSGIVYQTEDQGNGLIYRFLPSRRGKLAEGGKLQALALRDRKSADTRNWEVAAIKPGEKLPVSWVDIRDVESPKDDLRLQGFSNGAARFARGEGMWAAPGAIYFACTNGGAAKAGQIFRYTPSLNEGRPDEDRNPGVLELFIEPNDTRLLENADNLTIAPWGDVIICEDGPARQFVHGLTPEGKLYRLAHNARSVSEFTGAVFSPDGSTLFVNIQSPGLTLAITGPWLGR
ncbi:MAG TPA: alkaline phosphatase PhoX [Bryobacteraceae bacterium]|nr:alkaline phosphatase PhoX [Bryobacteraceae bacterium]